MLSAGNINDMTMAGALIEAASGRFDRLIADKGYDTNAIRAAVSAQGAEVVIPSTATRRAPIPYDRTAYRARNLVERLWCRLGLAPRRDPLRQARHQLSRRRSHRRHAHLLGQLSPEPSA